MKSKFPDCIEAGRQQHDLYPPTQPGDTQGFFVVLHKGIFFRFIVANEQGWEHVSVTLGNKKGKQLKRTPTWAEMCFIKDLFWKEKEVVVQFHVASKDHVNIHEYCLHLWKCTYQHMPRPPKDFV